MRYRLKGHESEVVVLYCTGMSTIEIAKRFGVAPPSVNNCLVNEGVSRRTGKDAHPLKDYCLRGHELSGDNLYVSPKGTRGCKACRKQYLEDNPIPRAAQTIAFKKWKSKNVKRMQVYQKNYDLQKKYGKSLAWYENKTVEQNNQCAICKRVMDIPRVDHDHTTDEVRDLLCANCNVALGMLQDDPLIAQAAADYLKRWKGQS